MVAKIVGVFYALLRCVLFSLRFLEGFRKTVCSSHADLFVPPKGL
jgi:hypothetical protein